MMENNFYDGSVTAEIVPNTHFFSGSGGGL